jgi:uncharacterized membrane protein YphA (DoxX/SURF4 family)
VKVTIDFTFRNVLRWLVGIIFIWAAISKLANLQDFYTTLVAYRLPLPDFLLRLTAITLPWLELFCGLMLLARSWIRVALAWIVVLCAVFMVCTGQAWARGLQIYCGCLNLDFIGLGGPGNSQLTAFLESVRFAFFRAILLLMAGLYLLRGSRVVDRPVEP